MKRDPSNGSDDPRPSDEEAIEATAAAWLAQRDGGLSRNEAITFARWRAADPRHETAVARLEGAWASLQQLRDFRPEAARHPDRDLLEPPVRRHGVAVRVRATALAAAALLLCAAGWWTWQRAVTPGRPTIYATTAGGYERVMLADGSALELNGDTSVEVRFSTTERHVRLARGEAHFSVARNFDRPFRVEAGGVAVRAVGTAFNVRLGVADVEVLVTEGKVSVSEVERVDPNALSAATDPKPTRWGQRVPPQDTLLVANERTLIPLKPAVATPPVPVVERLAPETVREALAWQGTRLVFVDTPLIEAIAQFNRRNPVQLELADAELGVLPIGGSFRAENVEAFLRLLETGGEMAVDRSDPARLVLRRAK